MRAYSLVFLMLSVGMSSEAAESGMNPLAEHKWKHRIILASFPATKAGKTARQEAEREIRRLKAGFEDRDMILMDVSESGSSTQPEAAEQLRIRFSLRPEKPEFVLIGKDGKSKERQHDELDLEPHLRPHRHHADEKRGNAPGRLTGETVGSTGPAPNVRTHP